MQCFSQLLLIFSFFMYVRSNPDIYKIPLDHEGNITLYWLPDFDHEQVDFEVHVQLDTSLNVPWIAIGFSDYGDLFPADFCIFWTDWKGNTHITDAWTDTGRLEGDDKQDCNKFRYIENKHAIKFSFSRDFDTCDAKDYIIEDGTTHIVWGIGQGPLYRISGLNISAAKYTGMQRTQLLKAEFPPGSQPDDTITLDFTADRVRVPNAETTYWCHVHLLPRELRERKHHVIQFGPAIQKGNEPLVHHMELFHCELPVTDKVPLYQGPCRDPGRPLIIDACKRVFSAWAMGASPLDYPEEAGLPIGGPDYNPYVMLEVHYNNPELKDDWVDSSGIKILVTPNLRSLDAGVMELGLEYTDKMAIPPKQPAFLLSGYCISECTAVGLRKEGIVIFGSQLHTHLTGIRVETRHVRNGRELPLLNQDNHYSTHFQEIRRLRKPVTVLPGDALITSCYYNTKERDNVTLGGFSISDEMCVNYVHYYPKSRLEVCKSAISEHALATYFRFLNEWDGQDTNPNKGVSANYDSVDWTPARASILQQMYLESPLSMQCNESSGVRFPGEWENTPLTSVLFPLPPKPRPACQNIKESTTDI